MMIIIGVGVYFLVSDEYASFVRNEKTHFENLSRKIEAVEASLKRIEARLTGVTARPAPKLEPVEAPAGSVLTTDGDAATTATAATSGEGLTKRR